MYSGFFPLDTPFLQARIWLSPWIENNILNMKTGDAESQVLVAQQLLEQILAKANELGHMVGDPEKQAARESLMLVHRGLVNNCSSPAAPFLLHPRSEMSPTTRISSSSTRRDAKTWHFWPTTAENVGIVGRSAGAHCSNCCGHTVL